MRKHFLVPSYKGKTLKAENARSSAAAALEVSLRLYFPDEYALSIFRTNLMPFASAHGIPELCERLVASVSKRMMIAVNSRVRNALILEMDTNHGD